MQKTDAYTVALAGNPNVGKSTVFNALTGLKQHTGNWPGKTVANACGTFSFRGRDYTLVDIPGAYSLNAFCAEEEIARDYILSGEADVVVVVCDATCLERNLNLVLQILSRTPRVIVCINLMDEAKKKHIRINTALLERRLGVPVVGTSARSGSLDALKQALERVLSTPPRAVLPSYADAQAIYKEAEALCAEAVSYTGSYDTRQLKLDRILTGKFSGTAIMLLLLALVFYITLKAANYPSGWLAALLFGIEDKLVSLSERMGVSPALYEPLLYGAYKVLAWVVAVMLPPMAIFFPLFTLLEDLGYLPRVAFNLDERFRRCHARGKQALTM